MSDTEPCTVKSDTLPPPRLQLEMLSVLKALYACHRAFSDSPNWTVLDDEARAAAEALLQKACLADTELTAKIVVEQRHRNAAKPWLWKWYCDHASAKEVTMSQIDQGLFDHHDMVQAFVLFERDHMQRPTDTARAGEADHWLNEARTQLRNGQAVLEKAERLEKALDSLTSWLLHRFGPDCPEGKEARTARKALLSVLPATPSPVTDEALTDEVQRLIAIAYAAGCQAVHDNYQEDRDPDFSEAASDYARSIDLAALASTPQPATVFPHGEDCNHEWVNEACDGNHYNCQHCPATFIYDRNIDKEPATAEQAVAAERERCAKIAENHFADERALGVVNALYMSTSIAAAIRQSAKGDK